MQLQDRPTRVFMIAALAGSFLGISVGYGIISSRTDSDSAQSELVVQPAPALTPQPEQTANDEILAQLSRIETMMAETERRLVAVEKAPAAAPSVLAQPAEPAPTTDNAALANLTGDDIDIFASSDGTTLAFIRPTKMWMKFDAKGVPTEIDAASVPADTRTAALARAAANTPTVQPVGDIDAGIASAEQAITELADPTPDLAINQLLAQPDIAAKIVQALDRLGSIDVTGAGSASRVFVFFDPRCPYCHRAFTALDGKVSMTWIPVLALGDDANGQARAAAILGAVNDSTDAAGKRSVSLSDDSERVARLRDAMSGKASVTPATLTEAGRFLLDENMTVLNQLYGRQTHLLGVPTIIQTNGDGTATAYRGYDEATVDAIIAREVAQSSRPGTAQPIPAPNAAPQQ